MQINASTFTNMIMHCSSVLVCACFMIHFLSRFSIYISFSFYTFSSCHCFLMFFSHLHSNVLLFISCIFFCRIVGYPLTKTKFLCKFISRNKWQQEISYSWYVIDVGSFTRKVLVLLMFLKCSVSCVSYILKLKRKNIHIYSMSFTGDCSFKWNQNWYLLFILYRSSFGKWKEKIFCHYLQLFSGAQVSIIVLRLIIFNFIEIPGLHKTIF